MLQTDRPIQALGVVGKYSGCPIDPYFDFIGPDDEAADTGKYKIVFRGSLSAHAPEARDCLVDTALFVRFAYRAG